MFEDLEFPPAVPNCFQNKLFHLGWENGAFSDVTITALGASYPAHRILLSQSPYFEKLLRGPWVESTTRNIDLRIDDPNIGSDTLKHALQFLYGRPVEVDSVNVFGILAVGCFLGLESLCQRCVDFALGDLTVHTFNSYYSFSQSFDYGKYTQVMLWACLDFLKLHGYMEAQRALLELDAKDLLDLLWDDDLWVPTEEHRFNLVKDLVGGNLEELCTTNWGKRDTLFALRSVLENLRYEHMAPAALKKIREGLPGGLSGVRMALEAGRMCQEKLRQELVSKWPVLSRSPAHKRCKSESSALGNPWVRSGPDLRAVRFGFEFPSVTDIYKRKGLDSMEFYYAGSLWRLRLVERRPSASPSHYIGAFIHRRQASAVQWGFCDKRENICASLKVRVGWAACKIERECSGRFNSETWDSYGWPQFMKRDTLQNCLEPDGSLRVVMRVCLNI